MIPFLKRFECNVILYAISDIIGAKEYNLEITHSLFYFL